MESNTMHLSLVTAAGGRIHGAVYREQACAGRHRRMLAYTTIVGYDTAEEAAEAINQAFPTLPPLDLAALSEGMTEGKVVPPPRRAPVARSALA